MTILRQIRHRGALLGFALVLVAPGAAMRCGLLSFDWRFAAMLVVSCFCIALCLFAGYSFAELGCGVPRVGRHWLFCGAVTALLAAPMALEAHYLAPSHPQPDWVVFAPFYALVSSPCQEVVCRAIPKLLTDRLRLSGGNYILFSSTVFALAHSGYGDPLLLMNTFFAGLAWATAYLLTRNIWPVAASHAAVGTFAFWLGAA
jgi:uncharacterized protein